MSDRGTFSRYADFLVDVERLKLVQRTAWVSDRSRHENSAEHSWHLALAMLTLARETKLPLDVERALAMALIHDLGEIEAGDVSVYDTAARAAMTEREARCIDRLAASGLAFGPELRELWLEYEAQQTLESRWVRVIDRFLPFITNLAAEGQAWKDRGITRSQFLRINEPIARHAPELYAWMVVRVDDCIARGWMIAD